MHLNVQQSLFAFAAVCGRLKVLDATLLGSARYSFRRQLELLRRSERGSRRHCSRANVEAEARIEPKHGVALRANLM